MRRRWRLGGIPRIGKYDSVKNAYYTGVIFRIERVIASADRAARQAGTISNKDSLVKSALRKAELALTAKPAKKPPEGALEEWTAALAATLVAECREMEEAGDASRNEAATCLGAVRDSLDTRREMNPGNPRAYLEFLIGFMGEVAGTGDDPLI